jgi:hypothetical protein
MKSKASSALIPPLPLLLLVCNLAPAAAKYASNPAVLGFANFLFARKSVLQRHSNKVKCK